MAALNTPASRPAPSSPLGKSTAWARRVVPTALVLAGLVAVAYWGHTTDWRFFFAKAPHPMRPPEQRTMWVEAGSGREPSGVCTEHGLPGCPTCDPGLAQLAKRPIVTPEERERARRAMAVRERSIGDPAALKLPRLIRFASADAIGYAGIDIKPAMTVAVSEVVTGSGELGFDPTLYARLTARAPGTAWRVLKRIGDPVHKGDLLALIDSAEVGKAKAELQVALVQVRLKAQAAKDLADAPVQLRQRKEADAALREAEIRVVAAEQGLVTLGFAPRTAELRALSQARVAENLQHLGLPPDLAGSANGVPPPGTLLPVVAPRDGIVLQANVVAGEPVDTAKVLFAVVDPRQLRLTLHVRPDETQAVRVGQPVYFRPDGATADAIGRVSWVGVNADETTRTVPIWADLPNPDGKLRAATLGTGRIVLREEAESVVIPARAVQTVAGVPVVFVRDRDYFGSDAVKTFHVRVVMVGARTDERAEIIAGLLADEVVATKGSEILADELRKNLSAEK